MAINNREYLMSVDKYNRPIEVNGKEAIALNIVRLILLEPGSDPLHPDMGVGLKRYRYALNMEELTNRIQEQMDTYLPMYPNAQVSLIRTPDKVVNIEINIDGTVYIYDSNRMPISINIDDLKAN
jgi:hypothetical protein